MDNLIKAVKEDKITKVKELINKNIKDEYDVMLLLLLVIQNNSIKTMKFFIEKNININLQDNRGETALMYAIDYDNIEMIRLLLNAGANPNVLNTHNHTALTLAIVGNSSNNIEIIEMLLNAGADATAKDRNNWTSLMRAITLMQLMNCNYTKKITKIVRILLNAGADVNVQNQYGFTALMYAIRDGFDNECFNIVKLLINSGADILIKNNKGESALSMAINKAGICKDNNQNLYMLYTKIVYYLSKSLRTQFDNQVLNSFNDLSL
jgi:ankyrin repeat protein